jgi:hypothetical protein
MHICARGDLFRPRQRRGIDQTSNEKIILGVGTLKEARERTRHVTSGKAYTRPARH